MMLRVDSEALTLLPLVGEDGLTERPSQSFPKQEGSEGRLTERSQGTYYHGVPPNTHWCVRAYQTNPRAKERVRGSRTAPKCRV